MRIDLLGKEMSQFSIDWQQEQFGIEEMYDPHKVHTLQDGRAYLGSIAYRTGVVLDIMKKDIPDRKFFEAVNFIAEHTPVYEFDFEQ